MWKPHNVALYLFMPHLSQSIAWYMYAYVYIYIYTHIHTHDMYRIIRLYKGLIYHMFIYIHVHIYIHCNSKKNTIPHLGSPHAHKKKKKLTQISNPILTVKKKLPLTLIITFGTTTSQVPFQKKNCGIFLGHQNTEFCKQISQKVMARSGQMEYGGFSIYQHAPTQPPIKNISSKNS